MTSHFACVATENTVVAGTVCDLSIGTATISGYRIDNDGNENPEYAISDNIVFTTDLTVNVNDEDKDQKAIDEADTILTGQGWSRLTAWEYAGDGALYAEVEPA
jgi:hypothetical protein